MTENGRSKGFGFFWFSRVEKALKAMKETKGKIVDSKPIFVNFPQRLPEWEAYLKARFLRHVIG